MGARETLSALLHRRELARWGRAARRAPTAELGRLRHDRTQARALREKLDALLATAEMRLALPRVGSTSFPRAPGTDWAWRPRPWRGPMEPPGLVTAAPRIDVDEGIGLFHDARLAEVALRQLRSTGEGDLAPFALALEVFAFDGSFLSLAIDLPPEACEGLKRRHLIRLDLRVEVERPIEVFARLNVRHGPNTETLLREIAPKEGEAAPTVEFDLGYSRLNEKRVEGMWLDLILEAPRMNRVVVRDLTLARLPRAEL